MTTRSSPSAPRRRPKWRFLASALLLLTLLALAPTIVAHSPARNWVAARALANLQGTVHVGGASLGWFSAPVFHDVLVRDTDGRPLLTAPCIVTSKSLLSLLTHGAELGEIRIEQPVLEIVCAGAQTNLEQAIAAWLQPKPSAPTPPKEAATGIGVRLEVVQAKLLVRDSDTGRQWTAGPLDASLSLPRDRRAPLHLELHGTTADAGRIDTTLSLHLLERKAEGNLQLDAFPLDLLTPLLRRVDANLRLEGLLTTQLAYHWGETLAVEGRVAAQRVSLLVPWLGPDRLHLERLDLPCRVSTQGNHVRVEQAELTCDLGRVALCGTLDTDQALTAALSRPGLHAAIDLDLARLAALLPNTLHLHKDTRITSGRLSIDLRSTARTDGIAWDGALRTAELRGSRHGQALVWAEPLTAMVAVHRGARTPLVLDQLRCDAEFLHVDGSGSAERATITAQYDLSRLAQRLGQFVDLGTLRLAGQGSSVVTLLHDGPGGFQIEGDTQVRQLQLGGLTGPAWREDSVVLRLDAKGKTGHQGRCRVDAGSLRVDAGQDRAVLRLLEPIGDLLDGRLGSVYVGLTGDLARWQERLRSWVVLPADVQAAGPVELIARLRPAGEAVAVEDARVVMRDLRFRGLGLTVQEPTLDLHTTGRWLPATGTLELREARVASPTGVVEFPALSLDPATRLLTGNCTVQGNLTRLQRWLSPTANVPVIGSVIGRVSLEAVGKQQTAGIDLVLQDVQALGCQVRKTEVKAALQDGWLHLQPVETTINQGRLRLQPSVRLEPGPIELHLATAASIERARLTPAACASALGYALPVLADVTEAEGELSVVLDAGRVSLATPTQADLSGRIIVHTARLGASPLLGELGVLLKGPALVQLPRELVVPFRLANGRVYHQNLELVFPDVTIRTQGSVGLDGSLNLIAELPVPPKWIQSQRLASVLAKQTIRLPIGGTLQRPRLDERALRAVNIQLVREAAGDVLLQELDQQLQRLLRPRK